MMMTFEDVKLLGTLNLRKVINGAASLVGSPKVTILSLKDGHCWSESRTT